MDKLLTSSNLFKGLTIAFYLNIIFFIAAVAISVGWTYQVDGFWDWEYLLYLCIFYGLNLSLTLLTKKWYENYLQRKKTAQMN